MNLVLKTDYWKNRKAREAFKAFILDIHGLDFNAWDSYGFWDETYTPFSFFKGPQLISSVCIYLLDAIIDGKSTRLAQISGVGTHEKWRHQGLSRQLTDEGLKWAQGKHEGIFLFADDPAIPYYQKCGFQPIQEYLEYMKIPPTLGKPGCIPLDPGNPEDLALIYSYAQLRSPLSNIFSIMNAKLLMFHVLYTLKNHIYEIPDLDCLIFYSRKDDCLNIFDIVSERIPSFDQLLPYILRDTDRTVEFHFHTDKLGIEHIQCKVLPGNNPFIKDGFPVSRPVFPYTSRA
ncbi:MAG: GNAT family N-acetyltransferase [Candidatus Marinimicrobia bacterium]|nr:GNAT family N-acetyltransferase [Candidatus Neomarinimicrobiota bacterium]